MAASVLIQVNICAALMLLNMKINDLKFVGFFIRFPFLHLQFRLSDLPIGSPVITSVIRLKGLVVGHALFYCTDQLGLLLNF
jgi:hypothetical protein